MAQEYQMVWQLFHSLELLFLCFLLNCVAAEPRASQEEEEEIRTYFQCCTQVRRRDLQVSVHSTKCKSSTEGDETSTLLQCVQCGLTASGCFSAGGSLRETVLVPFPCSEGSSFRLVVETWWGNYSCSHPSCKVRTHRWALYRHWVREEHWLGGSPLCFIYSTHPCIGTTAQWKTT